MEERAKKSKDNKKNNRKTVWKRDSTGEEKWVRHERQ